MNNMLCTVEMVPPSVNHYKVRYRNGNTVVSEEALAFKTAVATMCNGRFVVGKTFKVTLVIVLGKKGRGDIDNFPKLVLDALADCGVFRNLGGMRTTDAHILELSIHLNREERPARGYTTILVEAL